MFRVIEEIKHIEVVNGNTAIFGKVLKIIIYCFLSLYN